MGDNIKTKKRILVLNYEFPPLGGGASPVSYDIAEKLSQTGGFDIDVVTMGYKGLPQYEEINKNFRIYRVRCWRSKKELCHPWEQATYLVSAWFTCNELFKKNSHDICHCHFIIPTGVLAFLLKKKFGLPYIITSHGSDIPEYNTDRFQFLHKFTRPFLRVILNSANVAIAGSQYLADLANNEIKAKKKYFVIREGFESNKFTPQQKRKWIFSSGRLLPRKGFQYLIQAVSDKDIGYEVHIAGNGPMMEELQTLAEKSKTRIILHGWLDNNGKQYKDLLEQSAIYVLASEKENASVALLEAMSAGCAIITSNISGCPETVGDTGLVIEPRSSVQIADALAGLLAHPAIIQNMGHRARKRVLDNYHWDTVFTRYGEIYDKFFI